MRKPLIVSAAVLVFVLAPGPGARGQNAAQPASTPDISGVWQVPKYQPSLFPKGDAPLTAWGQQRFKTADPTKNDPNLGCLPEGIPRFMFVPVPMEIFQVPTRVVIIREGVQPMRQIYLNRKHRDDLDPTYSGDSVGKWEGETLVVDTIGLNDKTWLDATGLPHSEKLHVTERIHRIDHDTLVDDMTVEDPVAYTKPFTAQQIYKLKPGWEVQEYVCTENNKYSYEEK